MSAKGDYRVLWYRLSIVIILNILTTGIHNPSLQILRGGGGSIRLIHRIVNGRNICGSEYIIGTDTYSVFIYIRHRIRVVKQCIIGNLILCEILIFKHCSKFCTDICYCLSLHRCTDIVSFLCCPSAEHHSLRKNT